jgi:4-hydroxy-tetrahydrodipicolinate reductase
MKKIKIAVVGAHGRMGQEISKALASHDICQALLGIDRSGKAAGFSKSATTLKKEDFKDIDVVIDFSSKENFKKVVQFCAENKLPLVSGTTGVDAKDLKTLKIAGKKIPVLWSPNMSLGVAVLTSALSALAAISDFDFQIEEFHHNKKKDNPSGTAISLQKALETAVNKKCPAPIGIRGGGIFGIHKVYAMDEDEVLVFEHTALNRTVFARGAIKVADWICKQTPGVYQMKDVIG